METAVGILDWLLKGGPLALISLLVIFAFIWRLKYNHSLFFPANDENSEVRQLTDKARSKRLVKIASGNWEEKYLSMLGHGLYRVAQRYTKDQWELIASMDNTGWTGRMFGINPFTVGSYHFCLRLALAYPLLGIVLVWGGGGTPIIGGQQLLFESASAGQRLLVLMSFCLFLFMGWKNHFEIRWIKALLVFTIIGAIFIATEVSIGVTAALIALLISFLTHGLGAVATGFLVAARVGGNIATVIAALLLVAVLIGKNYIDELDDSKQATIRGWLFVNLLYICAVAALIIWSLPRAETKEMILLPVFLTLLPLLNGVIDWLSLGFTRGLLHAIRRRRHFGLLAVGWAILDIVIALVFLFLITSITTLVMGGLNGLSHYWIERPLLDLQQIFDGLSSDPLHINYWWIHFMMFTTLIPTLVHFFSAAYALVLSVRPDYRRWIVDNIDDDKDARLAGFLYVSFVPFLGAFGVLFMGWLLFRFLEVYAYGIGRWLLVWLREVAGLLDPGLRVVL